MNIHAQKTTGIKPIDTCKKVNFLTPSPTTELPAGNTEVDWW
jgi:hypothetical protein